MKRADAEHPEYDFVTAGGILVKLKWSDKAREYRAFKNTKYGLEDMKLGLQKVQVVFASDEDREHALEGLNVILTEQRGKLMTYTIRGEREEVEAHFRKVTPVFFEVLKLSLEEIFISETEVVGYDIRKFILG